MIMKTTKPRYRLLLTAGCAVILSACGGGGGSGGSSTGTSTGTGTPPATQTSPLTAITSANSTLAANAGYSSGSSVGGVVTGVSVQPAAVGVITPVLDLTKRVYTARTSNMLAGVTFTQACTDGGSIRVDASLHSQNTFSNGDTIVLWVDSCIENGEYLNGRLSMKVSGVSGDVLGSNTGSVTLAASFDSFAVNSTVGRMSAWVTGDMNIALTANNATSASLAISGSSLQLEVLPHGAPAAKFTLADYTVTGSTNGSTVTSAASFKVSGSSSTLGVFNYTVKNLTPFVYHGAPTPDAGALTVTGAGSSVTVSATGGANVRLDYNDGATVQTKTMSWSELLNAF